MNVASTTPSAASSPADALLAIYDDAMPEVYRYLHRRCRNRTVAEDLTTEVFLAAVDSIQRDVVSEVTVAWLIGIARHKVIDHWRRSEREQRRLHAVADDESVAPPDDPWNARLDMMAARDVLDGLGAHHRSALTLRYVDDLPVADVARVLDRTVHATEALLVRARRAFRASYESLHIEPETP